MATKKQKRTFNLTDDALRAFQQMMFHKLKLWDYSSELEHAIGFDVDSSELDSLAACLGKPDTAFDLTAEDLDDWLQNHAGDEPYEQEDGYADADAE